MSEIDLGVAILNQTRFDYTKARNIALDDPKRMSEGLTAEDRLAEIERFFQSKWGKTLCAEDWCYTKKALDKNADDALKQDIYALMLSIRMRGAGKTKVRKIAKLKKALYKRYPKTADEILEKMEEIAERESLKKTPKRDYLVARKLWKENHK